MSDNGERQVGSSFRLRRNYWHAGARGDLSVIARTDRDRTTTRVEVGVRAATALHQAHTQTTSAMPTEGETAMPTCKFCTDPITRDGDCFVSTVDRSPICQSSASYRHSPAPAPVTAGGGWFGPLNQVLYVLGTVGADRDDDGRFVLIGANAAVGIGGDEIVVGDDISYLVNGEEFSLASLLNSTSYGVRGVTVISA